MSSISLLAISDVHIGCPRLDPVLLHEKFKKYLYPCITSNISILFVCGDFFDTLLTLNAHAAFEAMCIIRELKELCRKVGCDLRVLRGTYTHDRDQPMHFVNGEDANDNSVRVFTSLTLEHHDKTGLNVLYIPDNLKSQDIYEDIRKLLASHNLEKADILIHHGYFKHMLPEALITKGLPAGCLEADKISKYVSGCVLNGHVHQSSVYRNVISVGSFDRLAHGEEEPKGFFRVDVEDGKYKFSFIENKMATKFLTFNLSGYSAEEALKKFHEDFKRVAMELTPDEPVRIRIVSADKAVVDGCAQVAKTIKPNALTDQAAVIKREQTIENIALDLSELPVITESNLCDLLMPIVHKQDPNVSKESISKILEAVGCKVKEEVHDD